MGEGKQHSSMERMIKEMALQEQVVLVGRTEKNELERALREAHLLFIQQELNRLVLLY